MIKTLVPFTEAPQLSKTDVAYATGDPLLRPFYTHVPALESLPGLLLERAGVNYPRTELQQVLQQQYAGLAPKAAVSENIEALGQANTFTVTTAHQPSLFLGPLYFVYKALTTIHLAREFQAQSGHNTRIVPIFVLGSEDHDLDELNHATLFGKKIIWSPGLSGPVGSMPADSTGTALEELKQILGESPAATALFERVKRCYAGDRSFAAAAQALLHEFFGELGLVVLNMNTPVLKRFFIPVMRRELLDQVAYNTVNNAIGQLNERGFKTQAAPREINLFYMRDGIRERIVREGGRFSVVNQDIHFSTEGILQELEQHPEHFSPNVVLRPAFQELVLPNLAYVGGGGELAYWLERKALFAELNIPFPMLVRRHSLLWLDKDAGKKMLKFGFGVAEIFSDTETLVRRYIERNASGDISLSDEIAALHAIFDQITAKAARIDPTLEKAVRAEEVKAGAGLEQWESRLVRAEKQKHESTLQQLRNWKEKLFPSNGLQERTDNFLPYVLKYGDDFFTEILSAMEPFEKGLLVLQEEFQ